jgi:CDP-diacylglycerol--glycerol-3-phosphate 3-phosphatidyltransferase
MCLIAVNGHPFWVTVLVYVTVAITVFSGVDYFFGVRRRISELDRTRADRAGA